ncbi:MAG: DUF4365 domain-containing protein [Pleurocapsa sp. SU_196_0]|nr:DUF4365 domain-containing protein [Pleurocapsa sp. SU_196_0]
MHSDFCQVLSSSTGSKRIEKLIRSGEMSFEHELKNLNYSLLFSVPIILIVIPINSEELPKFVWLQEYILTKLDIEKPSWKTNKGSVSIGFGERNTFNQQGIKKLERISKYHLVIKDISMIWLKIGRLRRELEEIVNIENYPGILLQRKDVAENIKKILEEIDLYSKSIENIPWIFTHQLPENSLRQIRSVCDIIHKRDNFLIDDWDHLGQFSLLKGKPPNDSDVINYLKPTYAILLKIWSLYSHFPMIHG